MPSPAWSKAVRFPILPIVMAIGNTAREVECCEFDLAIYDSGSAACSTTSLLLAIRYLERTVSTMENKQPEQPRKAQRRRIKSAIKRDVKTSNVEVVTQPELSSTPESELIASFSHSISPTSPNRGTASRTGTIQAPGTSHGSHSPGPNTASTPSSGLPGSTTGVHPTPSQFVSNSSHGSQNSYTHPQGASGSYQSSQKLPAASFPGHGNEGVEQWHKILVSVGGIQGRAVVALAQYAVAHKFADNALRATTLAADLLEGSNDQFCENIVTLLDDGWEQSLGALFSCARSL